MSRVVEGISEAEDIRDVPHEWLWLVEPLAEVVRLPAASDPAQLYCDARQSGWKAPDGAAGQQGTVLSGGEDDWARYFASFVADSSVPIMLLGDVGVGKTSWTARFLNFLTGRPNVSAVYYDHNTERGRLDNRHLDEANRLYCSLTALLLREVQEACKSNGLSGLRVNAEDTDEIAASPESIKRSTTDNIAVACAALNQREHHVFVLIDNLDEYQRSLQEEAVGFANFVATLPGVVSVISLRPETYHYTQARLVQPRRFAVAPPSLRSMLQQRYDYLWNAGGGRSVQAVVERFTEANLSLSLLWAREEISQEPGTLQRLHKSIIYALSSNTILEEMLQCLHNYNLREILEVVSCLLLSGGFAQEMIDQMAAGPTEGMKRQARENVVTQYLRGPYWRYRGRTDRYPVKELNILDIPGVPSDDLLVGIRVLQKVGGGPHGTSQGGTVDDLCAAMTGYGYAGGSCTKALRYAAENGYLRDVNRQKPWHLRNCKVEGDDEFVLAPAGYFLLERLLSDYASRYFAEIANVMGRSRLDGDGHWCSTVYGADQVSNMVGVLDLLVRGVDCEARRLKALDCADVAERFKRDFHSEDVPGAQFLVSAAHDCRRASGAIMASHSGFRGEDFGGAARVRAMKERLEVLVARAVNLQRDMGLAL